ncbi:MAG: hypothetical protein DRJ40_06565 [Thermoprotei archaeon]|nr:MAG: hypothetical protein DRJ40_06565 [Thermoprotei archaeon]
MYIPRTLHTLRTWVILELKEEVSKLLSEEIKLLREEGYRVDDVEPIVSELLKAKDLDLGRLLELYEKLLELPTRQDFRYHESLTYVDIVRERSKLPESELPRRSVVEDKVRGGFIGRLIGCMVGKPVEGWSFREIRARLLEIGEYPLTGYFPRKFFKEHELQEMGRWRLVREAISEVVRDDDIDYTILNIEVYRRYGSSFTTEDIGRTWLELIPYSMTYTAERATYRNLVLGLKPPYTAIFLNPYREWIGARIRADTWGYIASGDLEKASEYAYRDATLSHVKNAVYSAIMVAIMISHAYVASSIEEVVDVGLRAIPQNSRLAEAVRHVIDLWKRGVTWEEVIEQIYTRYSNYHPVHTIPNDAIVIAALLWGEEKLDRSIALAAMSGLDTDCNAATVGSIVGTYLGYSRFSEEIKERLVKPIVTRIQTVIWPYSNRTAGEVIEQLLKTMERHGVINS